MTQPIGNGSPSGSARRSARTRTTRASRPAQSQQRTSPQRATQRPDRVKISGEQGGPQKSPIDFGQNFGKQKMDLNGATLRQGARGENVNQLQEMLKSKGAQIEVDGKFGPETEKALKAFQDGQGIKSDGIVGNETLGKLNGGGRPGPEAERAQAEAAGQTQQQAGPRPGQTLPEPKVGTQLDGIRRSEPLPKAQAGGPQGSFRSKGTGYFPENSAMEGGFKDRKGKDLQTLQDYLSGKSKYVSVAMDRKMKIPYGKGLNIPELDKRYAAELKKLGKEHIDFRVVDTGGAFTGKGTSKIDIATANRRASLDPTVNGPLTLNFHQD